MAAGGGARVIGRPLAVTIIAWVSIAFGTFFMLAYGLAAYLFLASPAAPSEERISPTIFLGWSLDPAVYWTLVLAVPIFLVVDGIFLLKGRNWARLAAVIWWAFALLSLVYSYGLSPFVAAQALLCLLVVFFLHTRPAIQYFKAAPRPDREGHAK